LEGPLDDDDEEDLSSPPSDEEDEENGLEGAGGGSGQRTIQVMQGADSISLAGGGSLHNFVNSQTQFIVAPLLSLEAADQLASMAYKAVHQRQKDRGALDNEEIERNVKKGSELDAFFINVKQLASGNDGKSLHFFVNFNGGTGGYPSAKHSDKIVDHFFVIGADGSAAAFPRSPFAGQS
jgi:hypothetical protein